jgi:hypothetical protein
MTKDARTILEHETDKLASYLSTNAIKLAKATYLEEYEKCQPLVAEKLQYINSYLQVMSLFAEVNQLEAVRMLDGIHTSVYERAMDNIELFLKEDL